VTPRLVYKILRGPEWSAFMKSEIFEGSPDDLRDGFIHLSAEHQLAGTLEKHFRGEKNLFVLGVNVDALGVALKWETSRDGEPFPHLYGPLPITAVYQVKPGEMFRPA
jgi:uncharacterized protein (DUF952 family)